MTSLILRTRTLSDMVALDKRLYTSHHTTTDSVSRLEPDRVKLARNGCMSSSAVRLSLSNCTYQLHPCTVLTAAHHTHTRPPDVPARIASPQSLSNTYSSPATFFEGLLIREKHPLYTLGTLFLCPCDLNVRCTRIHSFRTFAITPVLFLFILGERTGSLLGFLSLSLSDFYILIFSHSSYS